MSGIYLDKRRRFHKNGTTGIAIFLVEQLVIEQTGNYSCPVLQCDSDRLKNIWWD